eukprot:TRINITY_DN74397_c0_g1_i1.p1 TRINITY_DN74397_c0_g1~~TRINITY_DN74397_c0_g1_i1.p1  ORF type:complete len:353 (+),score=63.07 TRINITY_DN74397_c0_g1_i1:88-1059(+)
MAAAVAGVAGVPNAEWWDIPYAPDVGGVGDQERTRFLRLHAAPGGKDVHGTVVVMHGGYWKNRYGLDDEYGNAGTASLAPFFRERGFSAVELEYRRRDHVGGGWPGTNQDILEALRCVKELKSKADSAMTGCQENEVAKVAAMEALRPERLVLIGHSAGGCLALWAAHEVVAMAAPDLKVALVLALAPVADLRRAFELRVSDDGDAVERYMRCSPGDEGAAERYSAASPAARLPVTFPLLVAWGDSDKDVPPALVEEYAKSAIASASGPGLVEALSIAGADHFDVVAAGSDAWRLRIIPAAARLAARGDSLGVAAGEALLRAE